MNAVFEVQVAKWNAEARCEEAGGFRHAEAGADGR